MHEFTSQRRHEVSNDVMRMVQDVLARLRAEFLEMPGLRLKSEQVQRLCGVERAMCKVMLDALVNEGFLRIGSDGRYARLTTEHAHPAQSNIRTDRRSTKAS